MIEKEQIQAGDHSPWSELSLTTGLCNNLGDPPHLSATSGTPASLPTPRKKKKKKKRNLSYYCPSFLPPSSDWGSVTHPVMGSSAGHYINILTHCRAELHQTFLWNKHFQCTNNFLCQFLPNRAGTNPLLSILYSFGFWKSCDCFHSFWHLPFIVLLTH